MAGAAIVSAVWVAAALLLGLGGLAAAQPPLWLSHDATIVTDLRVARGASDAAAREACAAMCPCRATLTAHVTTNWFAVGANLHTGGDGAFAYLCVRRDRRAAVARDGGSLLALQSIAVLAGALCPPSTTRLFASRDAVVVCLQTTSMAHALATGMYVSDVDAVSAAGARGHAHGWVSDPTSAHVGREDSPAVHIYFKRPLRPIVGVRVLSGVGADTAGATVCQRRLDTSWEQAGNGYVVDEQDSSKRHVMCIQRPVTPVDKEETTQDGTPALRVLAQIQIVASSAPCGAAFQEQTAISWSWRACLKYADASSATRFLSHVILATSSVADEQSLVSGFSLVSATDLNSARAGVSTYLMAEDSSAVVDSRRLARLAAAATEATADDTGKPIPLASRPPLRARVIDADSSNPKLAFKVLQIADLHLTGDPDRYCLNPPKEHALCGLQCNENLTVAFLNDLLDAEKPDLVMFSGDTITVRQWELKDAAVQAALAPVEARGIPYAWVMGNHDDDYVFDRQEIMDKLVTRKLAYVESGPSTIQGVGNYALAIKPPLSSANTTNDTWGRADAAVFRMYCLDSNKNHNATRFPHIKSRYDWIHEDQIEFYDDLSRRNQQTDVDVDGPVPAIMFFHIPIPEYSSLAAMLFRHGEKHEKTEGPEFNSGLLATLATRGEVKATFVGHDHTNEYCYKTRGVQLCYGGGTGFGAAIYGGGVARRARVIEWTMDSARRRRITSWKRLFGRAFGARTHEEVLYSEEY